jgi:hypothetical protein
MELFSLAGGDDDDDDDDDDVDEGYIVDDDVDEDGYIGTVTAIMITMTMRTT